MKTISSDAGLSQVYTNHCIRATCITTLDNNGFEARHIMSITGHKSETSIRAYSKTGLETKKRMCDVLSNSTTKNKSSSISTSTPKRCKVSASSSSSFSLVPDDSSFLDSCDVIEFPSSLSEKTQLQENLKLVSSVKTFDFAVNKNIESFDDNSNDYCNQPIDFAVSNINSVTSPNEQKDNAKTISQPNRFFSMFGQHPVFNNCTFNFS